MARLAAVVQGRAQNLWLDGGDRKAFRAWFTWLAEAAYFGLLPARQITDCSSLLRFAYVQALRAHTAEWAEGVGLKWLPPLPELRQPVKTAEVFRAGAGEWRQFADAENLMRHNARQVTREVRRAAPGDLLFYRQLVEKQPWHAMVVLERSAFEEKRGPLAVYHTGGSPGEVRRPTVEELVRHPEPRWRPVAGNANFLGVYRWHILSEEE